MTEAEAKERTEGEAATVRLAPGGLAPLSGARKILKRKRISGERRQARRREPTITLDAPLRYAANWITFASAREPRSQAITRFTGEMIVPSAPATGSNQLIYIFIGLQNDPGTMILQAVLQWNLGRSGTGKWSISTWFVKQGEGPRYTDPIPVQPGARLRAGIFLKQRRGQRYDYWCGFDGYPQSQKEVTDLPPLSHAVGVLEAYDLERCRDYPSSSPIVLQELRTESDDGPVQLAWQEHNRIIDCDQHCAIVGDRIELHCR